MNRKKLTIELVAVTFLILAIVTVIPNPSAQHISHLRYYSVCSFVPFSTVTLLFLAAVSYLGLRKTTSPR